MSSRRAPRVTAAFDPSSSIRGQPLTLERLFGLGFAPVAWLIGIPWNEASTVGALLGTKTVLNELLAYSQLAGLGEGVLSEHSRLVATYALCGFANFGSVGILVTGLSTMAPSRRAEIALLGARALIGALWPIALRQHWSGFCCESLGWKVPRRLWGG